MRGPIKGAAQDLNPIDPGGYGPACSTRADKCIPRAKPKGYICLPSASTFALSTMTKGGEWRPPYLPRQYKFLLYWVVLKAAMGRHGLHASDREYHYKTATR